MKNILCLLMLFGFLTACSSSSTPPAQAELSFKNLPPIAMAVSDFQIVNEYKSPMAAPNVEHLFAVTPAKAVEIWAKDRLVAKGGQFLARIVIRDASVKDTELPVKKGWRGWFTTEESNRYDGSLSVMMEIVRPDGYVEAYVSAKSNQSRTILEDASAADKERAWFDLTSAMASDINTELQKQISANLGPILTPSGASM